MSESSPPAEFEQLTEISTEKPTLIEGLPGHGMVASIAVDQITKQLEMDHHGNVSSQEFPPAVTFEDGLVQDLVRVYSSEDPAVMTLKSDIALPPSSFEALSRCVLEDLADEFDRAIFLAGAPAESEGQIGDVIGVGTNEAMRDALVDAGIEVATDRGVVGGVTGALVKECFHAGVPAALLVVRSHPFLPDPKAARAVIENALEPLVDFDIETTELAEQADEIQQQMEQIAQQYQQMVEDQTPDQQSAARGMFQ